MSKPNTPSNGSDICNIPCFEQEKVSSIKAVLSENENILPSLAEFYKVLGNATRLKILFALGENELCVCDIAHILSLSVAATSHQLKLLRNQGWLSMRNDGKMVYYSLENTKLLKALKGDLTILRENLTLP
ncbi:MAG: ArsR family transcriptional regulator, lead/cadmium/zinc/bismuth-responsive transcriptional repressor [Thiomicrorhabdus sp.]|nr:MAG: ArsR family transcriptional regulator, lead/cadmium/zinc/bismuth-responsive transcriptional repressor [Thiomicrorhabdus sp.]